MYRQKLQKHGIISTGLLMSIFFWNAGILRADTPEAPLLPMNVEFRYVPQYLDESNSRRSALRQNPGPTRRRWLPCHSGRQDYRSGSLLFHFET